MKYYKLNFSLSSENQPNLTVEIYSPDELEISIHWSNHGGNCNITPTSKTKRPYGKTTIFVELLKKNRYIWYPIILAIIQLFI